MSYKEVNINLSNCGKPCKGGNNSGEDHNTTYTLSKIGNDLVLLGSDGTSNKIELSGYATLGDLDNLQQLLEDLINDAKDSIDNLTDKDEQTLKLEGNTLSISNGNSVELPSGGNTAYSAISAYSAIDTSNYDYFIKGSSGDPEFGEAFPKATEGKIEMLYQLKHDSPPVIRTVDKGNLVVGHFIDVNHSYVTREELDDELGNLRLEIEALRNS